MGNEVVKRANPKTELVQQIGNKLEAMLKEQASAMPKDFNQTRFLQNCLTVLADTNGIEKCKPMSIVRTLIKGAYLGLDFFRKECYAIPYGDACNFQTDYKGEMKLCKKYGRDIKDIYAKLVQEGDDLKIGIESGIQYVNLNPKPFNDGKVVGAFAVVVYNDGTIRYETMSLKDIEDVRRHYSKAPNSPAWNKSYGEMCKKVVLRRLCKMIDLDFDNQEQAKAFEDGGDADMSRARLEKNEQKVSDPYSQEDATEAEVVEDPDIELREKLRKDFPDEEEWQLDIRVKEAKGEVEQ